jgi:hypothetical protein
MKKLFVIKILSLTLLLAVLITIPGCDDTLVRGGADVVLEGVNVGSVSMEGKPVSGLPSQKVNLVLKVATNQVLINTSGGKTTIKLNPSGATVVITSEGTTFSGVKPDQVQIQWSSETTTK